MKVKLEDMPELKFEQLQYEINSWKRLLGFMMEENVHLKNRLSEILKNKFNKSLLDQVEGFQNSFIKEDEMIGLLRNEIVELDKILIKAAVYDEKNTSNINGKLDRLRYNIKTAEKQFCKLKSAFMNYQLQNLQ